MRVTSALIFSDVHLGWVPCRRSHQILLQHLPALADDAELIIMNGDILDVHRGLPGPQEQEHVARLAELVNTWRREGREVVYIEGNHDPMVALSSKRPPLLSAADPTGALIPDRWTHIFEGASSEQVRVLHGHRFTDAPWVPGAYEGYGRHFLTLENLLYHKAMALRGIYPHSIGWLVGLVGWAESALWRRQLEGQTQPHREGMAKLIHGHFHFGPGTARLGDLASWRSGSWVAEGHRGTVNRLLRYKGGTFQRMALESGRWLASDDGR